MKHNLKITGNFFGSDGYSSHTRQLFNALAKRDDTNMKIETQLPQDWIKQVNDNELDAITKEDDGKFDNIIITMPQMWRLFTGLNKNYAYVIWEGDCVPSSWIEEFENPKIDYIFVPSSHTQEAILKTLAQDWIEDYHTIVNKIKIIPHGCDKQVFYNKNIQKQDDVFRLYCNKGWRGSLFDRGGVQFLLQAFSQEFSKDEKIELHLKLNPSYINPQHINQALINLNLSEDKPPININCEILSMQQLNELYNKADCFICPTRCESFGLPGLEAMSTGLANIQTSWGGQTDYMTDKNSLFIDYELNFSEELPLYENVKWASPKIDSIRKQMRWAFENQDKIKEMGKQAEEDSKKWTWDITTQKIMNILK